MAAIGRKCSVVNLDPANDHVSYPAALDVRDLITLDEVMVGEDLGPNGGILYALEELEHNIEWLEEGLTKLGGSAASSQCHILGTDHNRRLRSLRLSRPGRALHSPFFTSQHLLPIAETWVQSPPSSSDSSCITRFTDAEIT